MKNKFLQNIRGILIILVVCIHSLSYQENNIIVNNVNIIIRTCINFAVGVFIFLVAYFVKVDEVKEDLKKFYKKKIKRLVIPFLIWSFIYTSIEFTIKRGDINVKNMIVDFLIGKNGVQLYFLLAALQLIMLTPIFIKAMDKNNRVINTGIIMLTPIYTIINGIINIKYEKFIPMYGTIFVAWITYYYMGLLIKSRKIIIEKEKLKNIIVLLIVVISICLMINLFEYNKVTLNYKYCTNQVKFSNTIYTILIIIIIYIINEYYNEKLKCQFLTILGNNSFGIFCIHLIYENFLKKCFNYINMNLIFESLIISVLTLSISLLSIIIFNKITKKKFSQYIGF